MSADLERAKAELNAAQQRAALALDGLRDLAHFGGEELGASKRGHEYVTRLMREREDDLRNGRVGAASAKLTAAGMAAATRNDRARKGLELKSKAELAKYGVVYARIAARWRKDVVNETLNAEVAVRQGNTKAAKAHREKARNAERTASTMEQLLEKLQRMQVKLQLPSALSWAKTRKLRDASGGNVNNATVAFSRSVPIFESTSRSRIASTMHEDFLPWAQRQGDMRDESATLAALLASDVTHSVTIRDPQTGTTRTIDATNVDEPTCDWWCQTKKVLGVVGPAAGAGVAAAGGALVTKDPAAGAAVTGAGAMLAALSTLLGGQFQAGFDKGQEQAPPAEKPIWPWVLGAAGIAGAAFVIAKAK